MKTAQTQVNQKAFYFIHQITSSHTKTHCFCHKMEFDYLRLIAYHFNLCSIYGNNRKVLINWLLIPVMLSIFKINPNPTKMQKEYFDFFDKVFISYERWRCECKKKM